jgi:hypothetical protein
MLPGSAAGLGCRASAAGLRLPGFGCRASAAGLRLPGFGCRASAAGLRRYLMELNRSAASWRRKSRRLRIREQAAARRVRRVNVAVTLGEGASLVWIDIAFERMADRRPDNLVFPFHMRYAANGADITRPRQPHLQGAER